MVFESKEGSKKRQRSGATKKAEELEEGEKLKSQVMKNKKDLKMSGKVKNDKICLICCQEIAKDKESRPNGCQHRFCFDCLLNWSRYCKNECPQCSKPYCRIVHW
jgi:hypothetical protein